MIKGKPKWGDMAYTPAVWLSRNGGGYIYAIVHNVQADVPIENFITLWETFMEQRNY